jgi:hypothetical protein
VGQKRGGGAVRVGPGQRRESWCCPRPKLGREKRGRENKKKERGKLSLFFCPLAAPKKKRERKEKGAAVNREMAMPCASAKGWQHVCAQVLKSKKKKNKRW